MDSEWVAIVVTALIAVGGGLAAFFRWLAERQDERSQERDRINALYVIPTLFAAEDLQSRLYNVLDQSGLVPLRRRDPDGQYAVETVYLLARYLAWEQLFLRFTYLATDAKVAGMTGRIRRDLATDRYGTGPWTVFRPTQMSLGQTVTHWRDGALADTITFLEFKRLWEDGLGSDLGMNDAAEALRHASTVDDLAPRTVDRLARLQANLVDLINELEIQMSTKGAERFTVGRGSERRISARSSA